MKRVFFAIFVSALTILTSCDQSRLDIPQKGVISPEDFYQTDEDCQEALVNAYARFGEQITRSSATLHSPFLCLFNLPGDDMYQGGNYSATSSKQQLNEFRYTTDNEIVDQMYKAFYKAIYNLNLVIANFDMGESTIKDKAISECRVMRAFCYMMMALAWGTPPLITEPLGGGERPANFDGTQADLLKWCAKECDEALPYLDERKSTADKDGAVKVTKGWAWTIKGKALLYAGDYEGCRAALLNVINSGKYALVPGERLHDTFHVPGDGNEEKIFECNILPNTALSAFSHASKSLWQHSNTWHWNTDRFAGVPSEILGTGWGGGGVREDFALDLVANDGIDSYRRKAWIISFDEVIENLTYASDAQNVDKWTDPKRGIKEPGLYACGYWLAYKMTPLKVDIYSNSFNMTNFLLARYAEVLLMYAECQAVLGDSDKSGLKALNDIQHRAGSAHVSTACTLDEVKNEKRFEMYMEGCRFIDLMRWKDYSGIVNSGKNIPTLHDAFYDIANPEPRHRAVVTYSNPNEGISDPGFKDGKHNLFPFPYSEIQINENIVQNPGW